MIVKPAILATLAFVGLAAAGCVSSVQSEENMLSAAGFNVRVADTPEKVASLKRLPPHQFVVQEKKGKTVYLFADPTICGCLYYGSPENYKQYRQMVFQQNLANQQEMTALMNQDTFDFGPWGPGPWGGPWGPGGGPW
ncbi:hypothetical protein ACRC7T_18625 [Segnochrobactraceae bacterium EtOH-i3]